MPQPHASIMVLLWEEGAGPNGLLQSACADSELELTAHFPANTNTGDHNGQYVRLLQLQRTAREVEHGQRPRDAVRTTGRVWWRTVLCSSPGHCNTMYILWWPTTRAARPLRLPAITPARRTTHTSASVGRFMFYYAKSFNQPVNFDCAKVTKMQ